MKENVARSLETHTQPFFQVSHYLRWPFLSNTPLRVENLENLHKIKMFSRTENACLGKFFNCNYIPDLYVLRLAICHIQNLLYQG